MAKLSKPRAGSLQYWPRKRAAKIIPSVNWNALFKNNSNNPNAKGILGIIGYKVGMCSVLAKDSTEGSMTKGKQIPFAATVLEIPPMRIASVVFYKNNLAVDAIIDSNLDKELKRKIRLPKDLKTKRKIEDVKKEYSDLRVLVYSKIFNGGFKKTPDIAEIGIAGSLQEKLEFVKNHLGKDITTENFLPTLIDIRGVTRGQGLQGPVKRFGISLKAHKSEKGVRRPGSLAPWHPSRVTFRTPMAGQMGMFTRPVYNATIIKKGKISGGDINPLSGWKHYGRIKGDYIIVRGSIQGVQKRQVLLTAPLRKTRKQEKKKLEFIRILK